MSCPPLLLPGAVYYPFGPALLRGFFAQTVLSVPSFISHYFWSPSQLAFLFIGPYLCQFLIKRFFATGFGKFSKPLSVPTVNVFLVSRFSKGILPAGAVGL